jgi:periplasmic protein TonB
MGSALSTKPGFFRQGVLLTTGFLLGMAVLALLPLLMHHTSVSHKDFLARQVRLIAQMPEPFMEPPVQAHEPPPEPPPPPEPEPKIDVPPPEMPQIPPPEMPEPPPPEMPAPEPMDLAAIQPAIPGFETPSLTPVSVKGVAVRPGPTRFQRDFAKAPVPGKLARPTAPVKAPQPKIRFHSDELDRQPERISMVNPVYPYRAKRLGIQGVVTVKFLVDRSGAVRELTIIEADPPDIFNEAVMKTLDKWKFKPGRKDGKDVETWITTSIRFELE